MKSSFKLITLLLGLWISLQSCSDLDFINEVSEKENQNFQKWEGNINNVPLGHLTYKSEDIVEEISSSSKEMKTSIDNNGLYVLAYEKDIQSSPKKIQIEKIHQSL